MAAKNTKVALLWGTFAVLLVAIAAAWWVMRGRQNQPEIASSNSNDIPASEGAHEHSEVPGEAPQYAPVQLNPEQQQLIGVTTGRAEYKTLTKTIRTVGLVMEDETRIAHVHTRFSGWVESVNVDFTYQHVYKGEPLFSIYSPELVATQQELLLAVKAQQSLQNSSLPGAIAGSSSLLEAARARLAQWEISPAQIDEVERTGRIQRTLTILSPTTGHVTMRNVFPSTYVTPEMELYTITDHTQVWIDGDIYESEIGLVRVGQRAIATTDAFPGRQFAGRVSFLTPHLEKETRTLKVRMEFPNLDLELRPEMYAQVDMEIPLGRRLVVPDSAVLDTGGRQLVFVVLSPGRFDPHDVRLGIRAEGSTEILSGLKAGDEVATSANFLIDSESQLRAALGGMTMGTGVTEIGGQGRTAAASPPTQTLRIDLRTTPSPPQAGTNRLLVTVTDSAGDPVLGVTPRVIFFMPAMPTMGMAAMRTEALLTPARAGEYQGAIQVPTPGTWQVTITAEKGGAVLGSQQMNLNAR
ncbi:MAG: efflux RND transporter periplasmic adaptor subunit [Acidobacteria bacterium]|nr:efflux RND transporter periplasmic adaptor subunit [Acidobacteriota bacterium]